MEETNEEKVISFVLEEGMACVLTNKGRIFIQISDIDEEGNYKWREIKPPDLQNK